MSDFAYNYSKQPAPQGACPVCWHRNGRLIAVPYCDKHTNDEREFLRIKEQEGQINAT